MKHVNNMLDWELHINAAKCLIAWGVTQPRALNLLGHDFLHGWIK